MDIPKWVWYVVAGVAVLFFMRRNANASTATGDGSSAGSSGGAGVVATSGGGASEDGGQSSGPIKATSGKKNHVDPQYSPSVRREKDGSITLTSPKSSVTVSTPTIKSVSPSIKTTTGKVLTSQEYYGGQLGYSASKVGAAITATRAVTTGARSF